MSDLPLIATENLRTIALVGHAAAGKTTLVEQLLLKSGTIQHAGEVERGNTVSDHDALEKEAKHSLRASIVHVDVPRDEGITRLHVIDTPGYPDFVGQALGALDAVETVAVVVNATRGVELLTRRMMDLAKQRNLCRMIIVNKIDQPNVDLPAVLAELEEAFGEEVLPINLPANGGERVIDCFDEDHGEADFLSVPDVHRQVIEQIVDVDEAAMERYLEEGAVDPSTLHDPLEQALREGHLVPVCFVSARTGAGVGDLLDVMVRHLPHPGEGNPPALTQGLGDDRSPFHAKPDPDAHVVAHVFKVGNDPYVGRIGIFRVLQGTIRADTELYVGHHDQEGKRLFKVGHPMLVQGSEMINVPQLVPGDIGAVSKVEEIQFDAVLHDSHDEDLVRMRPLDFPRPMFGWALEPARRGDEGRLSEVLATLVSEDPTLAVESVASQNETVLRGLSELHLRSVLDRMRADHRLEVETRPPRVPYRESITKAAEGHARHKKQTGGAGQFGEVFLRVEPLERGAGFEFVDKVKGGVIPFNLVPAVEKGVREALATGHAAGYPLQDIRVVVHDGKHHPVDSKEVAFVAAGRKAMRDALDKAGVTVLEPIVDIEIIVPEDAVGAITADLSQRRGQITGTEMLSGGQVSVTGAVPLSEIEDYSGRLKGMTHGLGSYSIEMGTYEPVPHRVQEQLVEEHVGQGKAEV